MIAGNNSNDYNPITWVGRMPVYFTTLLVALHVAGFIGVALLMTANAEGVVAFLAFSSESVLKSFSVWQFVTYAFVHMPDQALWFLVEMYLLFVFGREVEKYLGRQAFIWLYVALLLLAPTILTAFALFGYPQQYAGSNAVNFAVFVAFVIIYPNAEVFFGIKAKWIAIALLAVNSLQSMAYHDVAGLTVLWLECGCAYGMLRARGVSGFGLPIGTWSAPRTTRPKRVVRRREPVVESPEDLHASIDPLLEKISKTGIGSLTKRERERLEQARAALIEREKHH